MFSRSQSSVGIPHSLEPGWRKLLIQSILHLVIEDDVADRGYTNWVGNVFPLCREG